MGTMDAVVTSESSGGVDTEGTVVERWSVY